MELKELVGKHYLSGFDTATEKAVDSWHEDFKSKIMELKELVGKHYLSGF